jgi:hypothetical protein
MSSDDPSHHEKLPQDPVAIANPERCRADFTYTIGPTRLTIIDSGRGQKSILEDLPAVLRKVEYWHQGSVERFELVVFDADGKRVH